MTLGNATSLVSGLLAGSSNEVVTGGKLDVVLDPSSLIPAGKVKDLQELFFPMGQRSAVFGANQSLHYGTDVNVRLGSDVTRRIVKSIDESDFRFHYISSIATATAAITYLGTAFSKNNHLTWERLTKLLGPSGACGVLTNLLLLKEKANGQCDAGIEKQLEAESLIAHADSLGVEYKSLLMDLAGLATDRGSMLVAAGEADSAGADQQEAEAGDIPTDASPEIPGEADTPDAPESPDADTTVDVGVDPEADLDTSNLEFGPSDADVFECYDGVLATRARHISLRARAPDAEEGAEEDTDSSLIYIDAQGGDGEDNGVVAINSTGQATTVCGPASFRVRREGDTGQIDADTGDDGVITLRTGGETGSTAVLDPETITLAVGAEGAGAMITMTSDGIKLSVGPDGGPCLELTTSGVTMSCGANSVAVDQSGQTTEGMNVSHKASMAFEAEGMMASLKGSAQTTVKGAITMIN